MHSAFEVVIRLFLIVLKSLFRRETGKEAGNLLCSKKIVAFKSPLL